MSEAIHRCELCGGAVVVVSDPDGEGTSHYERVEAVVDAAADRDACAAAWYHWTDHVRDEARRYTSVDTETVEAFRAAWRAALAYARKGKER